MKSLESYLPLISWGSAAEWLAAAAAFAGVIVTVILAIIAIWSDDIRAQLRRPRIALRLADPEGEWTYLGNPVHEAIYWHTIMKNLTPSIIANEMEVVIIRCEITKKSGLIEKLACPSPLPIKARRNHDAVNLGASEVAHDIFCCRKTEGDLRVLLNGNRPNNFPCEIHSGEVIEIEIRAQGLNAVSNTLVIRVIWHGSFPPKVTGLTGHMKIEIQDFPAREELGLWATVARIGSNIARREPPTR